MLSLKKKERKKEKKERKKKATLKNQITYGVFIRLEERHTIEVLP